MILEEFQGLYPFKLLCGGWACRFSTLALGVVFELVGVPDKFGALLHQADELVAPLGQQSFELRPTLHALTHGHVGVNRLSQRHCERVELKEYFKGWNWGTTCQKYFCGIKYSPWCLRGKFRNLPENRLVAYRENAQIRSESRYPEVLVKRRTVVPYRKNFAILAKTLFTL